MRWIGLLVLVALFISGCNKYEVPDMTEEVSLAPLGKGADPLDPYLEQVMNYKDEELAEVFYTYADSAGEEAIKTHFVSDNDEVVMLHAVMLELTYRGIMLDSSIFVDLREPFLLNGCRSWIINPIFNRSPFNTFGSSKTDSANDIFIDEADNRYIVGYTEGHMLARNAGGRDAFVCVFDANGHFRWAEQFGTIGFDVANGVIADKSGNVYVAGEARGSLTGGDTIPEGVPTLTATGHGAFLRKYDSSGVVQWTDQYGASSVGSWAIDVTEGLAGITTVGKNSGKQYLRTVTPNGTLLWDKALGYDQVRAVAADGQGNLYAVGEDSNHRPSYKIGIISKHDTSGRQQWQQDIGVRDWYSWAPAWDVTVDDSGNAYVVGETGTVGTPAFGRGDAYIRKYDGGGTALWTKRRGSMGNDIAVAITQQNGNLYVAGRTDGDLAASFSGGIFDAFVLQYDLQGRLSSMRQIGTADTNWVNSVSATSRGDALIIGHFLPNGRPSDAFQAVVP